MSEHRYCFAWLLDDDLPPSKTRAALWRGAKWPEKSTISISFLGGAHDLRRRVQAVAERWTAPGLANLNFEFRDDTTQTDIRIAFAPGGSWSRVGTTCRHAPRTEPTMNFGWLTAESTLEQIESVVLHEFGHALGLVHEHQNPAGGIPWNRDVIYAELGGPPNRWSRRIVDINMFQAWEAGETNYTAVDRESIMMYPIPVRWTVNGFSAGMNTRLSPMDKKFIAEQYP